MAVSVFLLLDFCLMVGHMTFDERQWFAHEIVLQGNDIRLRLVGVSLDDCKQGIMGIMMQTEKCS
jgi:hypothetical protein